MYLILLTNQAAASLHSVNETLRRQGEYGNKAAKTATGQKYGSATIIKGNWTNFQHQLIAQSLHFPSQKTNYSSLNGITQFSPLKLDNLVVDSKKYGYFNRNFLFWGLFGLR